MQAVKRADDRDQTLCRLMAQYQQDILRMCCAILRDQALAQDAAQETFIKAWRGLAGFRAESGEKTWLMRIAVNTCRDMQRTGWMRHIDRRVTPERLPEAACEPADKTLSEAVMRLPGKLREAVLLYYYQGMTLEETAQALGVSAASVFTRLKRARAKLRDALEEGEMHHA